MNAVSPTGRVLFRKEVSAEYGYATQTYSGGQLRIGLRREDETIASAYFAR